MHLAVPIVSFRNPQDIMRCLAALELSTYSDFEIIICENGGDDDFAELVRRLPANLVAGQQIRAISRPDNPGYAVSFNACINASPSADAWWALNPDTQPSAGAMAAMVERLRAGDCHAVGCTIRLNDGRVQSHGGRWHKWTGRAVSLGWGSLSKESPRQDEIERRQNYLNGASMLISRQFLETTGLMDEEYFLYCEEVDWFLRGLRHGMKLAFAPNAEVIHDHGTATGGGQDLRQRSRLSTHLAERNRLLLTRKCFPMYLPTVILSAILLAFYHYALRGAWQQFWYGIAGLWAGVRGERGKPAWMRAS
jgi:GT2 family glycosyltransferase